MSPRGSAQRLRPRTALNPQLHRQRLVKVFADSEHGRQRAVCSFVTPIVADRVLESPRHAARFVSLLPVTVCS